MRYRLSKLILVRLTSRYRVDGVPERATWWQWRGHVMRHRRQVLA